MERNVGFEHLHVHTDFSLLDGYGQVEEYADRAPQINQKFLCVTDHGMMGAVPRQVRACEVSGISPIFGCFPAGQMIVTKEGVKTIESVIVGDMVLTHLGRYRKVVGVMSRRHRGKLYGLRLSQGKVSTRVRVTGEHPILISDNQGVKSWVRADSLNCGRICTRGGVMEWKSYVAFPRSSYDQCQVLKWDLYLPHEMVESGCGKVVKGSVVWGNLPVTLDHDFGYFLGVFCAEGSFSSVAGDLTGGFRFTLNIKEEEIACKLVDLLQKYSLKAGVYKREDKHTMEVCVGCLPLAHLLLGMCGKGAANKKVPTEIFDSPLPVKKRFVEGLLDGDGKNGDQQTLKVKSPTLAWGFKRLLADMGVWGNVRKGVYNGKVSYSVAYQDDANYRRFWCDNEYVYKPLAEVIEEDADVDVFNFEVEEDNSYVTDFAVHNCELYMNDKHMPKAEMAKADLSESEKAEIGKNYHLLSIAYTNEGYSNLVQLTSKAWLQFYKKARVTYDQVEQHKKGIIFTSSCYIGEIGQDYDRYGPERAEQTLKRYIEWFSPNFYLEMMLLDFKKQKPYDKWLVSMHQKYGIPMIVTGDCLVAGTLVFTDSGFKPIEDIVVDDRVLTHANRFQRVEITGNRKLKPDEKVYRVKCSVGSYSYEATGNHKVRVANQFNGVWSFDWKRVEDLNKDDFQLVQKVKGDQVFADATLTEIDLMDFIDADEYLSGDLDSVRKGNLSCSLRYCRDREEFVSYRGFDCKCKTVVPRRIVVDDDFLEIVGWYMAEGWSEDGKLQVGFALHRDEQDVADFIIGYFSKYGILAKTYEVSKNGIAVRFSSKVFNRLFGKLCGKGAGNKHMPEVRGTWLRTWSKEQVAKFLHAYWKGDGHWNGNGNIVQFCSTSKKLIYEIATVFNALGLCSLPSVREEKVESWADCWVLNFSGERGDAVKKWFVGIPLSVGNSSFWYDLGECYALRVESTSEIPYFGSVYDMQVREDHSFSANLSQVSNCHYCRKQDSQQQRYMLMIRGKKTVKDFENIEDGADLFELQDSNLWMKSEEELDEKWAKDYADVIPADIYTQAKRNTVEIARKASGVEIDRSIKLPQIPDADDRFKEAVIKGYKWRGLGDSPKYLRRLKEEYELICRKGFASYFLIQQQITNEARRVCPQLLGWGNGDEAVGPGRGCLLGSVPVVMEDGTCKEISKVRKGDKVVTRDGSIRPVLDVLVYDCSEELLNIKVYYGDNSGVTLTGDHKVLAKKAIRPDGYDKWSETTKKSRRAYLEPVGDLEWLPASDISEGDWMFIPKPNVLEVPPQEIDLSIFCDGVSNMSFDEACVHQDWMNSLTGSLRKRKTCSRYVDFDCDWARLLGIFTGDGWLRSDGSGRVGFAFNSDDSDGIEFVSRICLKYGWDYSVKKSCKRNLVQVSVNSRALHSYMKAMYPDYEFTSQTKHVPAVVFSLPRVLKECFLQGYLQSDGHKGEYKNTYTTSSPMLASQVRFISWQCDVPVSMNRFSRTDKRSGKESVGYILNFPERDSVRYNYKVVENGILVKVRDVEQAEGDGKVYDLTVEGNHNYLTTSFLVHNSAVGSLVCYCMGITDVDPLKHDLLFSRFLSEARGGREMKTRFSGIPIPEPVE